jgi:hypothetical protein
MCGPNELSATIITVRAEGWGDALTCSECSLYTTVRGGFSDWKFCPGCGSQITRFDREESTSKMVSISVTDEPEPDRLIVHIADASPENETAVGRRVSKKKS